ncbi:Anaphase-promoting complex subunit 7 [Mortierella sp. GBA35]|nr:Anaphase-promoting complex subunit 7 [Mortierella sp. GBA35]
MATGHEKTYTPQERLAQLRISESLFDAGLYKSALLITGIHLCTVRKDEQWFEANALYRYARSLTKLQEHRRATEYYRKASYIEETSIPPELLMTQPSQTDTGANTTTTLPTPQQTLSIGMEMYKKLKDGKKEMERQRGERERLLEEFAKTTRNITAKPIRREAPGSSKTAAAPPPIPSVRPLSATMSKHLSPRGSDDDHTRKKPHLSPDQYSPTPVRSLGKSSSAGSVAPSSESSRTTGTQNPIEIKVDHALSCFESGDYSRARELLLQIPQDKRTVKIYLLLIQIFRKKAALHVTEDQYWIEIAKLQPFAMEAYIHMLRGRVALFFIKDMIKDTITMESPEYSWMMAYLQGLDSFFHMKYEIAHGEFTKLDEEFSQNTDIKLRLALCLRWMGKHVRACLMYSQVRKLDNHIIDEMYHYGACLKQLYSTKYLNKLASDLLSFNDRHPDTWCVQAMYWDMKGDREKALQMVSRALQLRSDHCGALQLRGQLYLEPAPGKALTSFKEAERIEKDIVTCEGLVNCYIILERQKEACTEAKKATLAMPDSAHALALYGTALYHAASDEMAQEAQDKLKEALQMDPACVQAASTLVMIYENQRRYEEALQVLDQQIDYQPPDSIHVRKAEIYTTMERWEDALSCYERARSVNPDSVRALEGMAHVEKILSGGDEEIDDEQDLDDEIENEGMEVHQDESGHLGGHLDEDDILTGEEDQGEDYDDGRGHRMRSPQYTLHQANRNDSLVAARARGLAQQAQGQQFHNHQQMHPQIPQLTTSPATATAPAPAATTATAAAPTASLCSATSTRQYAIVVWISADTV